VPNITELAPSTYWLNPPLTVSTCAFPRKLEWLDLCAEKMQALDCWRGQE